MKTLLGAVSVTLLLALGGAGCRDNGAQAQPKPPGEQPLPPRLEREQPWPDLAREVLGDQMASHKRHMRELLDAALFLQHERAETLATELARTPPIPRRATGVRGRDNGEVTDTFAAYQDKLRARARDLAAAARAKNNHRVARAYGQLTEVCVSCHAAYLEVEAP